MSDARRDAATAAARLHERDQIIAALERRLRQVLDCVDPKCALCAACLAVVRAEGGA